MRGSRGSELGAHLRKARAQRRARQRPNGRLAYDSEAGAPTA